MFIGIAVDICCDCIYYGNCIWIIGIFTGSTTSSYLDLGGLFVDQINKRKEKEIRPEGSVTAPYGFSERGLYFMIENVKETLQKYLDRLLYDESQYRKEALFYYPLTGNPSIENIKFL